MERFIAIIKENRWYLTAAEVALAALVGLYAIRLLPLLLFILGWIVFATVRPDLAKSFWQSLREGTEYRAKWIVFILSLLFIFIIWQVHTTYSSAEWIKQEPWSYLYVALTGLATTILGVTVYDVVVEPFRRLLEGKVQEEFLNFFGGSCRRDGITLVFPQRLLDKGRLKQELLATRIGNDESLRQSVEGIVDAFSDYPFFFPDYLPAEARQTRPEGVTSWVAYQDVQSGAHVAQLLARVRIQPQIKFELDKDRADKDWNISQISFGLGFNLMTNRVQEQFDKRSWGERQINALPFEVDYKHDSREIDDVAFKTDNILWQGELLRPPEGSDYAIIVRIVHGDKDYVTFICAGRTAYGTTAAGMYLAEHWKDQLKCEYDNRKKQGDVIDGELIDLHTHSLFVIVEHATKDPHKGSIAHHPKDHSKRLIHFELVRSLKRK